jgi:ABC-type nitrate/sulfonate/bicarbonate transport system substrate-binding protein
MKQRSNWFLLLICGVVLGTFGIAAADFQKDVGDVKVGEVAVGDAPIKVPFILWGGDVATFVANGGLKTTPDSIFGKEGLKIELTPGDDFIQQTRDYVAGKTPFLRGTFSQVGMATELIGSDPRTKGVAILQLTWSKGDHMVGRKDFKNLNDMKGKTFCLQQGGPHVGLLNDLLLTVNLKWTDINVVWAEDVTATKAKPNDNPAAMFRKDPKIDACFVITPDMLALTGGKVGDSKVAGQVDGAHVVVSTQSMNRSIADIYVCRKDFYDAHKDWVDKFVYGYLKGAEDLTDMAKVKPQTPEYKKVLEMTQAIYGKEAIPTLEDADGLISDADFAHFLGNSLFFTAGEKNTVGFEAVQKHALDLAVGQKYVSKQIPLEKTPFSYSGAPFTGLKYLKPREPEARRPIVAEGVLYKFTISFEPNVETFPPDKYGDAFQHAVEIANQFGACAMEIRGHADPKKFVEEVIAAGQKKGTLKAAGAEYTFEGAPLDVKDTKKLLQLVKDGKFDGAVDDTGKAINPKRTMLGTQILSERRAQEVKKSVVEYLKKKGTLFDESQFTVVGVGVSEPVSPFPKSDEEMQSNRIVEFRLVTIAAEK